MRKLFQYVAAALALALLAGCSYDREYGVGADAGQRSVGLYGKIAPASGNTGTASFGWQITNLRFSAYNPDLATYFPEK